MKLKWLTKRALLILGSMLILITAGTVQAKTTELKIGFYQHENHLFIKVANKVLAGLEEKTEGRYKFGVYPSEALGKAPEQLDMTNRGLVFANFVCMCYYPGTFPLFSVETIPMWSNGVDGVRDAFEGGLNQLYEDYLKSKGMTNTGVFGATAFSVRSLGSMKKLYQAPADMKSKRVRTLGLERNIVTGSGGSVLTMPMPQVIEALERNMLDGMFAQESNWIDWKLYETLDAINYLDLTTSPMSLIYSIRDMEAIDARDRDTVLNVLKEFNKAIDEEYSTFMKESREFLDKEWKGTTHYATPEEKKAFMAVSYDDAVEEYLSRAGEMGPRAIEIVKKYNP